MKLKVLIDPDDSNFRAFDKVMHEVTNTHEAFVTEISKSIKPSKGKMPKLVQYVIVTTDKNKCEAFKAFSKKLATLMQLATDYNLS